MPAYGETLAGNFLNQSAFMGSAITKSFQVGDWRVDQAAGRLSREGQSATLEPKIMNLLVLMAARPNEVFSKDDLFSALWPGVTVGEDTLARAVSKLRKALGDDPAAPRYIETISKRGYRLIAAVVKDSDAVTEKSRAAVGIFQRHQILAGLGFLVLAALLAVFFVSGANKNESQPNDAEMLTARADDFYMRFTRADNEAAIALYERVIAEAPSYAPAQAGLANALVQRVIRWPNAPDEAPTGADTLAAALDAGLNEEPDARKLLSRAQALAERAVRMAPDDPAALKAAGFVYSAQGEFDRAVSTYEMAVALDQDAWAPLINLGEIYRIRGDRVAAVDQFEKAYYAMERVYQSETQHVAPWHAAVGVVIGEEYEVLGKPQEAEIWYRRVLGFSPLEPEATSHLAHILAAAGDAEEAARLCNALIARIGAYPGCNPAGDDLSENP